MAGTGLPRGSPQTDFGEQGHRVESQLLGAASYSHWRPGSDIRDSAAKRTLDSGTDGGEHAENGGAGILLEHMAGTRLTEPPRAYAPLRRS